MYKVLVADDEYIVIKGIEKLFSSFKNDFVVSASAGDGDEALELLNHQNFDVLITDIRMPGIDGLTLIKKARILNPDLIIIILSGFEEIEYYQKALEGGVFAYLLKPLDIKEFNELFNKIYNVLSQKENTKKLLKTAFLNDVLAKEISDESAVAQEMKKYQISLVCSNMLAIVIRMDNEVILQNEMGRTEFDALKGNIINVSNRYFHEYNGIFFKNNLGEMVGFMNFSGDYDHCINDLILLCKNFISFISDELFASISIGIGKPCSHLNELKKSYDRALESSRMKFYTGHGSVNYYKFNNSPLAKVSDVHFDRNTLVDAVHILDFMSLKKEIYRIHDAFIDLKPAFTEVEKVYYQVLVTLEDSFSKNKFFNQTENSFDIFSFEKIKCMETIDDFTEWILGISERLMNAASVHINNNSNKAIRSAVNYIDMNFNRNISLNDVAQEVFMHPVYISQLFKKEMGLSFTAYINNLRMEKAKLYLKEHNYKIIDIAQMLGYSDEKHFYKVFKKSTGMTPNEYRNKAL